MTKILLATLAVGAIVGLTACGNAQTQSGVERFHVQTVDGVKCITWLPYDGGGDGGSMQCDFGDAK
ncbi:hypothetical protein [Mycobacterium sp. AZCC_0083]|uniref:hypothetical protein n=1 Tax=Mycobacterium sp. AZCC_0083 TaxID=2735882 RepID=UPI00162281BA|nr:hypothetical protein [Mycobacterium sp. AZCC_0083]MBB5167225.1 hypothetical protein [Mycobacterium sp. AZCC_0083]